MGYLLFGSLRVQFLCQLRFCAVCFVFVHNALNSSLIDSAYSIYIKLLLIGGIFSYSHIEFFQICFQCRFDRFVVHGLGFDNLDAFLG